jgi:hypothetical protein
VWIARRTTQAELVRYEDHVFSQSLVLRSCLMPATVLDTIDES